MEAIRTVASWIPGINAAANSRVLIDDFVFRLHYMVTASCLMLLTLFSAVLLVFDWIQCYSSTLRLSPKLLNVYCWMQNTYVINIPPTPGRYGVDVGHPGVERATSASDKVYIGYYQWIPFLLLCEAVSFKAARYFWRKIEHDNMRNLTVGFQFPIAKKINGEEFKEEEIDKHLNMMAKHIRSHWKQQQNRPFKFCFFIFVNMVNVVLNIVILNQFFGTRLIKSGLNSIPDWYVNYYNRSSSLHMTFPRVVKCSYFDYGAGGSIQNYDIMCFLPFNVYTEKFFVIFSLWLFILLILTALSLIYWLVVLLVPPVRKIGCKSYKITSHWIMEFLEDVKDYDRGDWYFMHMLGRNMHKNHYLELIKILRESFKEKRVTNYSPLIEVVTGNDDYESGNLLLRRKSKRHQSDI